MEKENNLSKILVIATAIMLIASSIVFWPSNTSSTTHDNSITWLEDYKCAVSEGIDPSAIIFIYSPIYCEACDMALEEVKYWENQSIIFIKIDSTNKNDTNFKKVLGCYGQHLSDSVPLMFCASDPNLGFVGRAPSRDLMSQFIYLCRSHADEASLSIQKTKDEQK